MISIRRSMYGAVALVTVLFTGCLEIETTTTVNTDGTFQREVMLKGDSAEVSSGCMFFQTDSTWIVTRRKGKDTSWVSTITKVFPDQAALAEALKGEKGKTLEVRVGLEKRFYWFTTQYTYSETLLCYRQINAVPLANYLKPAEVDSWMKYERDAKGPEAGVPEDSIANERFEKAGMEWDARNKFEAFFAIFTVGVERLGSPALTPAMVIAAKESLFARSEQGLQMAASKIDTLTRVFEDVLKTPLVRKAFEANQEGVREYERKAKFQEELLGTPYVQASIVMPGLVTSTNAEGIEGNRLSWKGFMPKSYVGDFTMTATSRVINWWAVVLTGVVIVALTGFLVAGMLRKRRSV